MSDTEMLALITRLEMALEVLLPATGIIALICVGVLLWLFIGWLRERRALRRKQRTRARKGARNGGET